MPTLTVLYGPDHGHSIAADTEPFVIGRSAADLQLSDGGCSRQHARLKPSQGSWLIEDLHSANGTYVNGQAISSAKILRHGDQIRIGCTLLLFHDQSCWDGRSGSSAINKAVEVKLNQPSDASIITTMHAMAAEADRGEGDAPDNQHDSSWSIIYHFAKILATSQSKEALLNRVADIVMDQLNASRLIVLRVDTRGHELVPEVARFRSEKNNQRPCIEVSEKITSHVLEKRDGVLCSDPINDERFVGSGSHDSIHRLGLSSVICVPIIAHDHVYGLLHADSSTADDAFSQEQLRLVVAIGWVTGIAIDNIDLHQTRMRTERLAATGETVAYLSHHMRNLLQGMQSGSEFIETGIDKSDIDYIRSGWQMIRRNIDRTLNFATNLLTFSKKRQPYIREVNVNLVVEDVLLLIQKLCQEEGISIETALGQLPPLASDFDGLHQVIHNIVLNAVQAVRNKRGIVKIATIYDAASEDIIITVTDDGPGISERELAHIFEAFHSGKGHAGTGLGLAASKKIIEELNGQINAETLPESGSRLTVTLPVTLTASFDIDQTPQPG
ncbi:FHA domain-containing protein [bacterium AH-315-J04]|nr:FHA domain-containing protein [bacterium AH-315-J04]